MFISFLLQEGKGIGVQKGKQRQGKHSSHLLRGEKAGISSLTEERQYLILITDTMLEMSKTSSN